MIDPAAGDGAVPEAPSPPVGGTPEAEPTPPQFASLPLSPRALVGGAFDLLAKAERDLRHASFYAGFVALVTIAPMAALVWTMAVQSGLISFADRFAGFGVLGEATAVWLQVTLLIAIVGFIVVSVESQAMAAAVLGARLEGRPLAVDGAVTLTRRRYWRVFWAILFVGLVTLVCQFLANQLVGPLVNAESEVIFILEIAVAILVQAPFAYAVAGIVIGQVGIAESLRRSARLFRARPGIALTVSLFGAFTQFVLIFGVTTGLEIVVRLAQPLGIGEGAVAVFLGTVVAGALSFAFGTLVFTAAALGAAPQVIAFVGLTHYVRGLDDGRLARVPRRAWEPYVSVPLAIAIVLGLMSLLLGIVSLAR